MSDRDSEGTRGPSPSEIERIEEACAQFEAAWRRSERPRIEDDLIDLGPNVGTMLSRLLPLELSLRSTVGESPSIQEYLSRFPDSREVVEKAFAHHAGIVDADAPPLHPVIAPVKAADLLTGILALQNGLIDHVALIAAIRGWAADRSRSVAAILFDHGLLTNRQIELLEALATEHRRRHGDDLRRCLSAFGALAPVIRAVNGITPPEIDPLRFSSSASTLVDEEATTDHGSATEGKEDERGDAGPRGSSRRFQVMNFHNAGMLGQVFIALDRELNRNVALKEIQEKHVHHPVNRDQFVLEGMITGALEHPGIVPVYSMGTQEDGRPFYAMRFIQGPSLREKLKQLHGKADAPALAAGEDPPTTPRLLRHFIHACHAMAYAHSRGVIHRDLKPEHILLGPFGETLVVDWGLAMAVPGGADAPHPPLEFPTGRDAALAQDGVIVGTLAYMSPEQAEGRQSRLDRRSDVYALGAILYAILAGRPPILGGDHATLLAKARRGDFPPPRDVARNTPPALEAICLKAMAQNPADRYPTATDLARDVERWLDDEPTIAYPDPFSARVARWLRRHRTAAVAAAVGLICTTIGLTGLVVQTARANVEIGKQRDRAESSRAEAVAARTETEKARQTLESNFRTSMALVEKYLLQIASDDMAPIPGATKLQSNVAALTTGFLEELWKQKPNDPETCRLAARSYRELANIRRLLGRTESGAYNRAVGLLRRAMELQPDEPRYPDLLNETLRNLASAYGLENRPTDAVPHLREAMQITEQLREKYPNRLDFQRSDARTSNELASALLLVGEFDEAASLARRAAAITPQLADSNKAGPTDALEAVMYLTTLGEAEAERGRFDEAEQAFADALRRAEAGIAGETYVDDYRMLRSLARLVRGTSARPEQEAEAITDLDAAIADFDTLRERFPDILHYSEYAAEARLARASSPSTDQHAWDDLGQAADLVEALLKRKKDDPSYSGLLGRIRGRIAMLDAAADPLRARAGIEAALELIRKTLKINPRHPESLRAVARLEAALQALPPPA